MPLSLHFDYCSFVVSFKTGKCESSNFILFQDCFGFSESLAFPYALNFLKDSYQFLQKSNCDFDRMFYSFASTFKSLVLKTAEFSYLLLNSFHCNVIL